MRRKDLADLAAFVAVADNLSFRAEGVTYRRHALGAQPHDAALRGASRVQLAEPHDAQRLAHRCGLAPARAAVEQVSRGLDDLKGEQGHPFGRLRLYVTRPLAQLGAAARVSFLDIADLVATAKTWSDWVVAYRYPSEEGLNAAEPTEDELRRALVTIDALAARLRAARTTKPLKVLRSRLYEGERRARDSARGDMLTIGDG